ncbi:MAG: single-stranded DNA-binding protein, partial [Lachnospiraceae bacterium]|nr:single-stranded DNA-binding protein [Lachnospiraceae bacterium]
MNNVILMGRLVRDPEIRYGQNNGKAVCRYTLAVDRYGSSQDGQNTDFIDIVAFDKNGEFAEK